MGTHVFEAAPGAAIFVPTGDLFIEFGIKVTDAQVQALLVQIAEPELASRQNTASTLLVTDPLRRDQWHLRNTGHHRGTPVGSRKGADVRVWEAWAQAGTLGSESVTLASSTSRDQPSDYSNFGREIPVCAPSSGTGGWGIADQRRARCRCAARHGARLHRWRP